MTVSSLCALDDKTVETRGGQPAASVIEAPVVTAADVLNRAADLLSEFGWCQHHIGSKKDGVFCALGAFEEAERDLGLDRYESPPVCAAFRALGFDGWHDVLMFNNAPGRAKHEVIDALREAARLASQQ